MIFFHMCKKRIKSLINKKKIQCGKNVYIDPSVTLIGMGNIKIGDYTVIGQDSWLNINKRDSNTRLKIGRNCLLGRRFYIGTGEYVEIGDYFLSGEDCKLIGANHNFSDPFVPYIIGDISENSIIRIGTNVWFGAGVTVIGDVEIGHGSVIGANSVVTCDVPPFSLVVGKGKIIKRYDFSLKEWIAVDKYDESETGPSEQEYKEILENNYPIISFPLEAITNRFGNI